jgi:hypothetical protein
VAFDPFYGAQWDTTNKKWGPEVTAPEGFKNAPSSAVDRSAYLYDEPVVYADTFKLFETVAVVPETGETLGALRWGVGIDQLLGGEEKDCTDEPTASFSAAFKIFHAAPKPESIGAKGRREYYDAIVDGFIANDGVAMPGPRGVVFSPLEKVAILTQEHERKLDPVIARCKELRKENTKLQVQVGGFADPTETDPRGTSEQRARAVKSYFVGQGVPASDVDIAPLGTAWVLYTPGVKEGRNRRVQIRILLP